MTDFFTSRWVDVPEGVRSIGGDQLAAGFIAGGPNTFSVTA